MNLDARLSKIQSGGQSTRISGRLFFLLGLLGALLLAGCQGAATRPAFRPIRPDPTSTPTVIPGGGEPAGRPTSVVSDQVPLSNYTHPTKRFSISYPDNWQLFERADGVIFIDSGNHAGYSVAFNDVEQAYSEQELNQYLVSFVAKNFTGAGTNFKAISQEQKADGSVVARFSSFDANLGQAVSEVRVQQVDTIVFVVLINATETQWAVAQHQLQRLADTFTPLETGPAAAGTPTLEPPVWVLIGPTSNKFGFLYPSDWKVLRQDTSSAAVGMPDTELVFEAKVVELTGASNDLQAAAEQAALAYVEELDQEYENVQNLPPQEFPLDTLAGATIDFLYTDRDGTDMAGSIITAVQGNELYQVVFSSSAETYQAALEWFNPMYKSVKILPAEQMLTPEP